MGMLILFASGQCMSNKEKELLSEDEASQTLSPPINNPQVNSNKSGLMFLLKELAKDESFLSVCRALFHSDNDISIGASLVLGHLRDRRALPYLLRALLTSDQKRAEALMWALGEIGDESSIPFLLTALEAHFVVKSAILALGKIGSPVTAEPLLKNLADSDEVVRLLAAKALGQIRYDKDRNLISTMLQELRMQLGKETSRRVKLMVAVICSRLEKNIEQ